MKKQMHDGYISVKQACSLLSPWVTKPVVVSRVSGAAIPSIKVGGARAVPLAEIKMLVDFYEHHADFRTAFQKLQENGAKITFRALRARVEKGKLPTVIRDNKHWFELPVLNEIIHKECLHNHPSQNPDKIMPSGSMSTNEAFNILQAYAPWLSSRTFSSWVEKGRIKSTKDGFQRVIPESEVEETMFFFKTHVNSRQASKIIEENNISISAHSLDARISRGRLETVKFGNQNWIDLTVLDELIAKEKAPGKK